MSKLQVKLTVNEEIITTLVVNTASLPAKLEMPRINLQGPLVLVVEEFDEPKKSEC